VTQNKALKKIGLIAKELNLPIYVIRLWEKKINILKPVRNPEERDTILVVRQKY